MTHSVEHEVIRAIARQKRLQPELITRDSALKQLGISSLDAITIVYEIEEIYDVEVDNEKLEELLSVQDIIDGVTKLIEAKSE